MTPTGPVVALRALGTDVDVRVGGHDPEQLAEALRARWHLCLRDGAAPAGQPPVELEVALGGPDEGATWAREAHAVRDSDRRRLLQRLTQSITHAVITARTGELLMLHAAGLADPATGAAAVFVAPGNTGKTTLCRTLGPARAYVTDETVGVRRDGTLVPYPKPLSVRRPDWAGVKDETAPGDVGLVAPPVTPWLAGVVLLRREPEHRGEPLVEELDVLDAVLELTPESSGFMGTREPLQWLAEVLGRTGGAHRVTYAEAQDLEPLAAEICGRASPWAEPGGRPHPGPATAYPAPAPADSPDSRNPLADGQVRTVPSHDELHHDGESLVLLDGTVTRVSALGTLLRDRAVAGATREELTAALEEEFGTPPQGSAAELTGQAVDTLLTAGLLRRRAP